jgi:hypothetical protein
MVCCKYPTDDRYKNRIYYFYFLFHLIIEGMTEANIIIAETKKIKRTELRNLTTVAVENCDEVGKELENNCSAACVGITLVIIKNTRPILNAFPVITKLVLIPADAPLL